jgi:hypothetical protein
VGLVAWETRDSVQVLFFFFCEKSDSVRVLCATLVFFFVLGVLDTFWLCQNEMPLFWCDPPLCPITNRLRIRRRARQPFRSRNLPLGTPSHVTTFFSSVPTRLHQIRM